MCALELDRIVAVVFQAARGARRDDSIAPRPKGKMRHRRLFGHPRDRWLIDLVTRDPLVHSPDIVLLGVAGEWRSESHDCEDLIRCGSCQFSRINPSKAPADEQDPSTAA